MKFKLGPGKTRDGRECVALEISDKIYGKILRRGATAWASCDWSLEGEYDSVVTGGPADFMPNVEPFRFEAHVNWELRIFERTKYLVPMRINTRGPVQPFESLHGKRGTLIFTGDE